MVVLLSIVGGVVVLVVGVAFLHRFYRKATRERALIRTGAGGQKVVMDGGFLVLPFLHRVEEINMRTMRLEVHREGALALLSEDRLRLEMGLEFSLRVEPSAEGVATAAQAIGARALHPAQLAELFDGRFVDAVQAVVASSKMDRLHEDRAGFAKAVGALLASNLKQNGLRLETVSLTKLEQSAFASMDENNAFSAVGMRQLAEVVASNKKARVRIETEAEVAVRQTKLNSVKRRLEIEREQREAEILQQQTITELQSRSGAETALVKENALRDSEQARLSREKEVRSSEIARDLELRQREIEALLQAEQTKIDSEIALIQKRVQETQAQATAEHERQGIIQAQEDSQKLKERLIAQREHEVHLLRAQSETEVAKEQTSREVGILRERAEAESQVTRVKASADKTRRLAEAEGKMALIGAENAVSDPVLHARLEMHKIDKMPEIADRMLKPVEKIDSIRINHLSGFGQGGGERGGSAEATRGGSPVNQAIEGVLNMALQLPTMRKLGATLGVALDDGDLNADPKTARDRAAQNEAAPDETSEKTRAPSQKGARAV